MNISIFGLGYVGSVTAAALAKCGNTIWGVDISATKTAEFGSGKSPVLEDGLAEIFQQESQDGKILGTTDVNKAVEKTSLSMICVGTPSKVDGSADLSQVFKVIEELANAILLKDREHIVILRSTVPPGTTAICKKMLEDKIGRQKVHLAFNPEFLREGVAIKDFFNPPFTILGTDSKIAETAMRNIYNSIRGDFISVPTEIAEMTKMVSNAWHANKIVFANEIDRLASFYSVSGRDVMNLIVQDKILNISPAYMKPGFAFGGSCLPKDVRALTATGRLNSIQLPLLEAILESNKIQVEIAARKILSIGERNVGILGLAFKPGTEDLRESPAVSLAEILIGKGCRVRIFDPTVQRAKLLGSNRAFIEIHLPHLSELLVDAQTIISHSQVLILTNGASEYLDIVKNISESKIIIDVCGALG